MELQLRTRISVRRVQTQSRKSHNCFNSIKGPSFAYFHYLKRFGHQESHRGETKFSRQFHSCNEKPSIRRRHKTLVVSVEISNPNFMVPSVSHNCIWNGDSLSRNSQSLSAKTSLRNSRIHLLFNLSFFLHLHVFYWRTSEGFSCSDGKPGSCKIIEKGEKRKRKTKKGKGIERDKSEK